MRPAYVSATRKELFEILSKETPQSFYVGKIVTATVIGTSYKELSADQVANVEVNWNTETQRWQCTLCMKDGFTYTNHNHLPQSML